MPDNEALPGQQNTLRGRFMEMLRNPDLQERAKRIAKGIGVEALKGTVRGAVEGFALRGGLPGAVTGGLAGGVSGLREGLRSQDTRTEVHGLATEALGATRGYVQDRLQEAGASNFAGNIAGDLLDATHNRVQGALDVQLGVAGQRVPEQARAYQIPPVGPPTPAGMVR